MQAAHSATMDDMSGGLRRTNGSPAGEPDPDADDPADELHFCCICGALLGFDPEDEIDGEGPGKDICGSCNATRNDEALMGG
jgi:hypothetical protein